MNSNKTAKSIAFTPVNNDRLNNLCGPFNEHLHQIETYYGVEIRSRSNAFRIIGHEASIENASSMLNRLYDETANRILTPDAINRMLRSNLKKEKQPVVRVRHKSKNDQEKETSLHPPTVRPHSENQKQYVENIRRFQLNFAVGPAGTGKTYLAVATALEALRAEKVKRIILVRPAVEAGEKLGFLPGDLTEKVLPYLRPLYDALYDMFGFEEVNRLVSQNTIEIAPLAYMRGRTLSDAFIILDEGQNTTRAQMKMFLTRMGFGSTVVITGDITQIDLPFNEPSGLIEALKVLKNVPGVGTTYFKAEDAVRHPIVEKIIRAYDAYDAKKDEK